MEGLGGSRPTNSDGRCLDTEPGWEPLLHTTRKLYETRRECLVNCNCVASLGGLRRNTFTIGSLVLSEIVKQNGHRQFRADLTGAIGPAIVWFLDIAKCTLPDGATQYLSDFYQFGYESLRNKGWNMRSTINA